VRAGLKHRMEQLPLLADRRWSAYLLVFLLSVLAWAVRLILDNVFPPGFPYLTFFPAVILSSFLFGRGPGTVSAIICGLLAWYFFIPPAYSLGLQRGTAVALVFYVGVVSVDIALIHWMQRANKRLLAERERNRQLAEERGYLAEERGRLAEQTELLFSELQHRVSNNLQMVGAVLTLQKRGISDSTARQALEDASSKLQMIGRIQRQLYSTSGEQVTLDVFLPDLMNDLIAASGKPGVICSINAEPGIMLPPDAAIPLALIMAEAVANAIEHGFAEREFGCIAITLGRRGSQIELSVHDDGQGLPAGFDFTQASSLGLKVARTLASNLGATLIIESADPGTRLTLVVPTAIQECLTTSPNHSPTL